MWHNRKKNQTIERILIIEQNKQPKFSERFSPPKRILIDFIIYSVHFTSVEIPSAISWYLSLISSISTNCCCCCSYESTPDNPIHIHTQRERRNTHQIETMEKRKIAQWSKRIELSLTDQKKITYIHIQLCSFVHSLIKSLYLSGEKANCTQIDAQLCLKKLHMHIHPVQKWVRKVTTSMMRCGFVRKYGSNRWQAGLPNKYIHSNFISLCHMLAQLNSTHSYARALACSLFTFHTKADLVVYTV